MVYTFLMASQDLLVAISDYRSKGQSDEKIREDLHKQGWSLEDINGALAIGRIPTVPSAIVDHSSESLISPSHPPRTKHTLLAEIATAIILLVLVIGMGSVLYVKKIPLSISSITSILTSPFQKVPLVSTVNPLTDNWITYTASPTVTLPALAFGYPTMLGGVVSIPHAPNSLGYTFSNDKHVRVFVSIATPDSTQTFQQWITAKYGYIANWPHTIAIKDDQSQGVYALVNGRLSFVVDSYLSKQGNSLYLIQLKNHQVLVVAILGGTIFLPNDSVNEKNVRDSMAKSITISDSTY